MCGIAGFFVNGRTEEARRTLGRMTDSLRHRGPDDEGFHIDDQIALGARRLSIIDLETGQQPLTNEDGTVHVIQNGEIYNFPELRRRLERHGHRFRTRSDTEVIAHAYEVYGDDCVAELDGMFALAIWDTSARRLLLARDRMGEKPLYYHAGPDGFVFGSELRALLAHPSVPAVLSLESLSRYLAFEYVPAPYSIFAGVQKLLPGQLLTVSPGGKPTLQRYWDLEFRPDHSVPEREWADRLLQQLEASVRRRMISDVPLGMFLSGGIDSGAIVALAARANGGRRVKTFTIGFPDATFDERPYARLVAQHCGAEHEETVFSAHDMLTLIEKVGGLLDEPLVDSSFLPTYALSRFARRSVVVTLSGDGGDELFCGYPTFLAERGERWIGRLPRSAQTLAAWVVNRLPPSARYGSPEFLLKQFFRGLPHSGELSTQLLLGGFLASEQSRLFSPAVRAACASFDPYEDLPRAVDESGTSDTIDRLIYQHSKFYLADQNLVNVDRASMACGLEVRAPFLDHALVDLVGRIPAGLKLHGWTTKYILKRALEGVLPASILHRRKQGFGVPIGPWLRGPLRDVLQTRLAADRVAHVGLFDPTVVQRLVVEHVAGRRDHRKILWALLMLDAWRESYVPKARWS